MAEEQKHNGDQEKMNVLDLPPRKEVHQIKAHKSTWKLNANWARFLIILVFVLIVLVLSYRY